MYSRAVAIVIISLQYPISVMLLHGIGWLLNQIITKITPKQHISVNGRPLTHDKHSSCNVTLDH